MDKSTRHEKAEDFRKQIKLPSQRMAQIEEFLQKEQYDEMDELRIKLLFQKLSYLDGCESAYRRLLTKIQGMGKEELVTETRVYVCLKLS